MTIYYRMAYRINDKLTFIHISKTAGTSITHWIKDNQPHEFSQHTHDTWHDLPEAWRDNVFCVVRNPYERVVSFWTFLTVLLGSPKVKNRNPERSKRQVRELEKGFRHFVLNCKEMDFAKSPERPRQDWHQLPQLLWLPEDLTRVKILRMENLDRDFSDLMKTHGIQGPSLPRKNVSQQDRDYRQFYDEETKVEVEKYYGEDIARLGYEF